MQQEPATIVSVIVGALTAVIGVLVAFGLDVSDDQRNAIIGAVAPLSAVIALLGPIIRQFVWSPESVKEIVDDAYEAIPGTDTKPTV